MTARRFGGRASPPSARPLGAWSTIADPPQVVQTIGEWATNYLSRPHPELGRPGPVCPYVPQALAKGTVAVAVWPHGLAGAEQLVAIMESYRSSFATGSARAGPAPAPADVSRALLVLFPALGHRDGHQVIELTQRRLKTAFVEAGLMIGEFHAGPPPAPGLWNPRFRPLWSPAPLLAIRPMVRSDLPFLRDDPRHLAAHRARFG